MCASSPWVPHVCSCCSTVNERMAPRCFHKQEETGNSFPSYRTFLSAHWGVTPFMLVFWFYCLNCQQLVFLPDFFQLACRTLKVFLPKGKWDKSEIKEGENTADERVLMRRRAQWQHSLKSIMKLSVRQWLVRHSQESKIPCTPKSWRFISI